MEHSFIRDGVSVELFLNGRFTYADNKAFLSFLDGVATDSYKKITIDLKGVEFIDSAALGILLLTKDKCTKASIDLVLRRPQGQVDQMFRISRFNELFAIEN
jgi:anti-anti-sigma factor